MSPFFSIIITTYNRINSLKEALKRIELQTFQSFEVIIVDDCSNDGTKDWVEKHMLEASYDIHFLQTSNNSGGPAKPRNLGLKKAIGKWICFCDSDDYFYENHLSNYYQFITEKKLDNAILSSNALVNGNALFFPKLKTQIVSLYSEFKGSKFIFSSVCIDNNELLPFKESEEFVAIEDYVFLLENMVRKRKHYFFNNPSVFYEQESVDSIRLTNLNGQYTWAPQLRLYFKHHLYLTKYFGLLGVIMARLGKYLYLKTFRHD
ncbi:glycosyltransferase family 2 protein [Nubsella zeaxanthinifaciens]|uniref:glycosyltransferase family 2 protein n=1 Tax=Nubsella zeaxanthinifaciens TaxID=392412 RepID=UPI0013003ED6|nr:glycosyltransferase family 2 protein [Nubsella zeaxanthinifaciens]